ncbi:ABC transporter ATP-binding protein [Streptomonospora litoralis]|uniref:Putative siderophore transport system ATP-binding protein YusV n=1 Tax=Streptomonospora litoralis TaxID=2498135 RepID=A0A4P6Q6C0_9ACTN|nr:ABC transporter ATP-binding protein [Streptomonospora litoralis]QBI56223.1 putative siderophore transport system ATP-binding protein YusV [Streptomonospora litoralis]
MTPRTIAPTTLAAADLSLGYRSGTVVDRVSVTLPPEQVTVIVGPNGCGKSTLLRGLARLLKPQGGAVLLDGSDIARLPAKSLARQLGLLPQQPVAPDGITAADLIARGRHPHQRWFRQFGDTDAEAISAAMAATGVTDLADRPIEELSGGQRQRVWIALALAQDPDVMLLDEPTTYLDLAHQVEVLELLTDVDTRSGRTIVLVLHDLDLAGRYADHLIVMKDGEVAAQGPPSEVVTADTVESVFSLPCTVIGDPLTGTPIVLPRPGRRG